MRNKTTAIILAVIFGYWSWIYTYKLDAWKFWISLVVCILFYGTFTIPICIWVWTIIDASQKLPEVYLKYK